MIPFCYPEKSIWEPTVTYLTPFHLWVKAANAAGSPRGRWYTTQLLQAERDWCGKRIKHQELDEKAPCFQNSASNDVLIKSSNQSGFNFCGVMFLFLCLFALCVCVLTVSDSAMMSFPFLPGARLTVRLSIISVASALNIRPCQESSTEHSKEK